jgi:hypothetical protein
VYATLGYFLWLPANHDSPKLVEIVRVKFLISSFGNLFEVNWCRRWQLIFNLRTANNTPTLGHFVRPRVKVEGPRWMQLLWCNLHTSYSKLSLYLWTFWVSTKLILTIKIWNGLNFRSLGFPCLAPQLVLSDHSFFLYLSHQGKVMPSFLPTSN